VDLDTVTEFAPAATAAWRDGDAWLGGGTWLFSQPQPRVRRLLDLHAFGWTPLTETDDGLRIAATCTLAELARWQPRRPAYTPGASLGRRCCDALLGSFKVQNVATVGGNICLSLPAGPMTSLAASLDGIATLAAPGGGIRRVPVATFVTGDGVNTLAAGELLTHVDVAAHALAARTAFRQVSLSPVGRSAVLVIARLDGGPVEGANDPPAPDGPGGQALVITVTAATPRPVQLRFPGLPTADGALSALDAAAPTYLDDIHGGGSWRAAMTRRCLAEAIAELAGDPGPAR
jgi:CO/xanthine dehydrogenase FAD-binding subunit